MDSQTRHALKQDKFVRATQQSASWVGDHRSTVIRWSIAVVVVLALVVSGIVYYTQRSTAAETALGSALDTYSSQLAQPGAPPRGQHGGPELCIPGERSGERRVDAAVNLGPSGMNDLRRNRVAGEPGSERLRASDQPGLPPGQLPQTGRRRIPHAAIVNSRTDN